MRDTALPDARLGLEVDIQHDPTASAKKARVDVDRTRCGESHDEVSRVFTVNSVLRPQIDMRPGERQFWRILNAAPDRYVDIELTGQRFEIVAFDGFPIASYDLAHPARRTDHILVPPAGRIEAIVEAPTGRRRSSQSKASPNICRCRQPGTSCW